MTLTVTTRPAAGRVAPVGRRRRDRSARVLGYSVPASLVLLAMALYPMVVLFRMSVSDVGPTNIIGHWNFVGLANFAAAVGDPATWAAALRTLALSAVLLVSNLVLGFLAGAVLSEPGRLTNLVLGIMVFVWALPPLVSGSVWKFVLNDNGAVNAVLGVIGIPAVPWLSSPTAALWTVSAVTAWASLPFSTLILRGGMLAINRDVVEAAAIDGAGYWRTQVAIVLPLLRPTLWILAILTVIYSFKSFDFFYVLTQGGPGTATNTLPVLSYYAAFNQFEMSSGATVAVLSMVVVAVFAVPYVRSINREDQE
ncbi:ABC-type sugar transport system permease subunit [Friedmanniella endophytica]|uniref:ABC-type sugar transport system permease subunit n=1 Tax=Microlunatus kandeliicorticis TaxID=1759536 RepID=A0A7W3IPU0_9ACTN|nr:sugar ABC transporter permease [Microlunatus kandeliicorticis]MBA8793027.1 ABC-type sugar transport system permease subunit [Microlunatus kandeliicorticis]